MSDSATPLTVAHQASLSMEFSRQEYYSALPFLSPEDLSNPGIERRSPPLQANSLPLSHQGSSVFPLLNIFFIFGTISWEASEFGEELKNTSGVFFSLQERHYFSDFEFTVNDLFTLSYRVWAWKNKKPKLIIDPNRAALHEPIWVQTSLVLSKFLEIVPFCSLLQVNLTLWMKELS